jgi:hypothetical protein
MWSSALGALGDDHLDQPLQPRTADRRHDAILRHVPTDRVRKPDPLAHQQQAGPMQHHHALLLHSLHGNKAHGRPAHCLADRLGIGGIVLLAFDVGLHVARRHQPDIVPEHA